jgi:hypothetical protein
MAKGFGPSPFSCVHQLLRPARGQARLLILSLRFKFPVDLKRILYYPAFRNLHSYKSFPEPDG